MELKKIYIIILFLLFFVKISYSDTKLIKKVYFIQLNGMINSVMESYLIKNIKKAEENRAMVVLKIDTPGGVLESTRKIILTIINSKIPVIGYVSPEGARAASAGAFIMLSCDKAFMSPLSHIGAAHPVTMGKKMDKTMETKVVNDTVAFIKNLAKAHHRNINIAIKMVKNSISLTAREAVKKRVVDDIVKNDVELLRKIKKIKKNDDIYLIRIKESKYIKMNIFELFLLRISNPNIAYILLILGIYGILAEFSSPGIGFAGIFGSISLILAFMSLNTLPINLAGVLLIIAGVIFFILEIHTQSGGILGIGAVVSIILGSIMLIKSSDTVLQISPFLIISVSIFTILFLGMLIYFSYNAQKRKPRTGREEIIGAKGVAKSNINPTGTIYIEGELWKARSFNNQEIKKGEEVEVVDIKNLLLVVKRVN